MSNALKCPVCSQVMIAPIMQCKKGHSVCGGCVKTKALKKCPICTALMSSTRNFQLEELIANYKDMTIKMPCSYSKRGCKCLVDVDQETEEHQAACRYRSYSCPGVQFCGWKCAWTGIHGDVLQHLAKNHKCPVLEFKGTFKTVLNFQQHSEVSPVDYNQGRQLFLFKHRVDAGRKRCFWMIQYVGPKDEARQYYYELELSKGVTRKFKVTEICASDVVDIEDVFESEKCVSISFSTAKSFTGENNVLLGRYRVMKVKEESEVDIRPRVTRPQSKDNYLQLVQSARQRQVQAIPPLLHSTTYVRSQR